MIRTNIDRAWSFVNGKPAGPSPFGPSRTEERIVNLPHDFTIETDSLPQAPGGPATGYYCGGLGTYTKMLDIPSDLQGQRVLVEFDGAYMNTVVEMNGQVVAKHHYGYTPFHADITSYIKPGKRNRLTVTVNNTAQPNSRWYSGSGIYRHVDLLRAPKTHIAPWGIFAYTSHIVNGTAFVIVESTIENHSAEDVSLWVDVNINKENCADSSGKGRTKIYVPAGEKAVCRAMIKVENADLWDIDTPNLYRITAELKDGATTLDRDTTTVGIRTITVDAVNGFRLNGQTIKLKGGCVHHDNGLLGAVSLRDSEFRKMKAHKENGYNAIRSAHNPPSRDMLEVCDRLGLLVLNEAFDCWVNGKNPNDYSLYFEEHWKSDIEAFVLRDRNHPSIVMWSTGNEIIERGGLSKGYQWAAKLADWMRQLDPTRPITNGVCSFWNGLDDHDMERMAQEVRKKREAGSAGSMQNMELGFTAQLFADYTEAFSAPLDVVGYNYMTHRYEQDGVLFPDRVICGTESFPNEIDRVWDLVEKLPHVIGDFTWTSYDYIGEAGIGKTMYTEPDSEMTMLHLMSHSSEYPWRLANDADFDICGFPRPQLAYRKIVWGSNETFIASRDPSHFGKKEIVSMWGWPVCEHIWNWEGHERKPTEVDVYSAAEEVELILNGKSLGRKPAGKENRYIASFELTYEPGTLEAISYVNGSRVSSDVIKTAGTPVGIRVVMDKVALAADGQSLCYASIELIDGEENLVPTAARKATAKVEGAATLAAFGTSNPKAEENYTRGEFTSYQGRLMAIVRAGYENGTSRLTVTVDGLAPVTVDISVQ